MQKDAPLVLEQFVKEAGGEEPSKQDLVDGESNLASLVELLNYLEVIDLRPRLDEVSCSSLLIHGTEDKIVPVDAGRHLLSLLRDASFYEVPAGAHLAWSGKEAEVNGAIKRFLNGGHSA